jgi:hypothetical protein
MRKTVRCARCDCRIKISYHGTHEFYVITNEGDYLCESCNGKLTFGQDDYINLYKLEEGEK